jgi:hypothetical protein
VPRCEVIPTGYTLCEKCDYIINSMMPIFGDIEEYAKEPEWKGRREGLCPLHLEVRREEMKRQETELQLKRLQV